MKKFILVNLLSFTFIGGLIAEALLIPSTAELEVKAGNFSLDMEVALIETDGIWEVSSKVKGVKQDKLVVLATWCAWIRGHTRAD